jgi:hypothetical protein
VTIDQRGKHPTVDISRDGNVIGLRQEMTDRFVAIPVAFDLVSMLVKPAAAVTVGENIGVIVLERFLEHEKVIL